jgi:GPI ethanolamine phosphate transferase 3 subunit O
MRSEMPTVTTVRVKSLLTGALNSLIEVKDNFKHAETLDDSILKTLRQKEKAIPNSPHENVVFCGGYSWVDLYGENIDRAFPKNLYNVADLDDGDATTMSNFHREFDTKNWTLMIAHVLGVDHAGHYYNNVAHPETERKLGDAEVIVKGVVDKLDNDTVLLVFGDHGMTDMGGHGADSQEELGTILFAYSKGGFPMKKKSEKVQSIFN